MSKFVNIILVSVLATSVCASDDLPPIPDELKNQCEAKGYCENVPEYPKDLINKLISEGGPDVTSHFFKDPAINTKGMRRLLEPLNYCHVKTETIAPQLGKNVNNEWVWMVNTETQQSYSIESCVEDKSQCISIITPANGHTAQCTQKKILREALVVNHNKRIVADQIWFNSCCNCELVD